MRILTVQELNMISGGIDTKSTLGAVGGTVGAIYGFIGATSIVIPVGGIALALGINGGGVGGTMFIPDVLSTVLNVGGMFILGATALGAIVGLSAGYLGGAITESVVNQ